MPRSFLKPRAAPRQPDIEAARYEDARYARQRQRGFRWLRFAGGLEDEYRASPRGRRASRMRLLLGIALLALSSILILGEMPGVERFLLAVAIFLGWIGVYLMAHENRDNFLAHEELRQLAKIDGLTGAMNRRAFHDHLQLIWRQAEREKLPVGLLLMDLDHFKQLNDRQGHQAGDQALRTTADTLKTYAMRPLDAVGRYGGDEFIMIWYGPDPDAFASLVQLLPAKLWMALAGVLPRDSGATVSGGAVLARPGKDSIADVIHRADEELYRVKRRCRGIISLAPEQAAADEARAGMGTARIIDFPG